MKQIICPISNEKINEQITRLNAIIGIVLVTAGFAFQMPAILFFLAADFFVRAFTKAKHSPISYISHWLTNTLNLGGKAVDKAPKIFAARLGFLILLIMAILFVSGFHLAALFVGGIFMFFATLEFALAICVGCIIYTYLIVPFIK
ncbi:DUF4395 domain-containing protein [Maribellus sp. YY47]|uniref:DUF4395 domain-containing protein n=1 Tax=Maribellus sp. YY47 TaxID=2929486 RepID=UPI0020005CE1|nr:DUF4395 domain-containing protein [Maribellus sp. YY47]MCK3683504.1 DUF4395 domain-containing protein [Maribellus sp. YY47]